MDDNVIASLSKLLFCHRKACMIIYSRCSLFKISFKATRTIIMLCFLSYSESDNVIACLFQAAIL